MRILVTGGAGFIGSNLVRYLLGESSEELGVAIDFVVTLDKLTYAGNRSNLDELDKNLRHAMVVGDIADTELVGTLLRDYQIDAVMHLAAESHVDRSIDSPEEFIMTNIVGTYRLLETFRRYLMASGRMATALQFPSMASGGKVAFLHVSTDEVYGSLGANDPAFCETTAYSPSSPYSASKAASDHLVRSYYHTYGMPVIITNCSNIYGPYQFPEKLLPLMIQKTLKGESLPVYGDGSNVRDWLYVNDCCRGLAVALICGNFGEAYALGGKCELKNIDMVRTIIQAVSELSTDRSIKTADELITFVNDRPGHDQRYAIDPSKIERELGWAPRENFASGLRRTVQWYLDHQDWIKSIEERSYRGQRLGALD